MNFAHRASRRISCVASLTFAASASSVFAQSAQGPATRTLPPGAEAMSLLGDTLRTLPLGSAVRTRYEEQLADAKRAYDHTPRNVDSIIWYARRLGYLGRLRESIAVYSRGAALFPNDPWLFRHRGHRYISVREFDNAIRDLERAATLVQGKPDIVEPDGQPNAANQPIGTLHSNINYHLALAYYLKGEYANALPVLRRELTAAKNDDRKVSIAHWLYMSLRRLGRDAEAGLVAAQFTPDMHVVENMVYHRLMLLYRGVLSADSILTVGPNGQMAVTDATAAYGLGNWHWYNGRRGEAEAIWRRILAGGQWGAFGYIAAETEIARMRGGAATAQPAGRGVVITDTARARSLFVSKAPADLAGCGNNCDRDIRQRMQTDSAYAARATGVMDFKLVTYKSRVDGLEIPAYLFAPLTKKATKHSALVWVHGGVHSNWGLSMWPFVKDAIDRGYVIIAPNYRGSTGYGDSFHRKIDYGGMEVDDALSAVDYLKTVNYVDMDRLGMMGWSHGGFITAHNLFRDGNPFRAGAAMVPVTNLIFRLSDHAPSYARDFAAEEGIQGMPFENIAEYIKRSPVFQTENLKVPMLVHVATNDCDVYFRENQQFVYTLRALKPDLAETKIYINPPQGGGGCGHTFNRRVNATSTARDDTPEQIDSWSRTWTFFDWNLRPQSEIRKDNQEWKKDPRVASPRVPPP